MSSRKFYINPVFIVGMFMTRKRNTGLKKKLKQFCAKRRYTFFFLTVVPRQTVTTTFLQDLWNEGLCLRSAVVQTDISSTSNHRSLLNISLDIFTVFSVGF